MRLQLHLDFLDLIAILRILFYLQKIDVSKLARSAYALLRPLTRFIAEIEAGGKEAQTGGDSQGVGTPPRRVA